MHETTVYQMGKNLDPQNVLQEYPRPLLKRSSYINLNGYWDYAFTKEFKKPQEYDGQILVPFSPETVLSGVCRQLKPDEYLWYRRTFTLERWNAGKNGRRLILHFGAVDQACAVYINGKKAARHTGGYLPFETDITALVRDGENELTVAVKDLSDTSYHARGKQRLERGGMFYTAQSGSGRPSGWRKCRRIISRISRLSLFLRKVLFGFVCQRRKISRPYIR